MNKHRRHGRIDAARQTADDIAGRPDGLADLFDLFFDKLRRRPVAFAMANIEEEISQYLFAKRRMRNLRVKLDAVNAAFGFSMAVTTSPVVAVV